MLIIPRTFLWCNWIDGLFHVSVLFLCVFISLSDKQVFREIAECELLRTFGTATLDTAGKFILSFLVFCNTKSVVRSGWDRERRLSSMLGTDKLVFRPVVNGRSCVAKDGRWWLVASWLWHLLLSWSGLLQSSVELISSRSFLFLLIMSNCSESHDLTATLPSLSILLHRRFKRRSSKEFCLEILFHRTCSKYLAVAFLFTSFILLCWQFCTEAVHLILSICG